MPREVLEPALLFIPQPQEDAEPDFVEHSGTFLVHFALELDGPCL